MTWLEITPQFSLSRTQLSSQISFTARRDTLRLTVRIQIWPGISGVWALNHFTKSPFYSLIVEPLMVSDIWMVTALIHINGSMRKVKCSMWNIISKLIKELGILLENKQQNCLEQTKIMLLKISLTILLRVDKHLGLYMFRLCLREKQRTTDLMYSMLQRCGLTQISH